MNALGTTASDALQLIRNSRTVCAKWDRDCVTLLPKNASASGLVPLR